MLELNANAFLEATSQLARLHTIVAGLTAKEEVLLPATVDTVVSRLEVFKTEAEKVGAKLSVIHASRFMDKIKTTPVTATIGDLATALHEIESRFADHLISVKMFVLSEQESMYLQPGHQLLAPDVATRYPGMVFEVEESAKCLALGRATASAFHSMRAVEVMLGGFRKFLAVPDPEKPAERNWAIVLRAIKEAVDAKYPAKVRKSGSEGAKVDAIYTTLDAIKNPWRNATMHVEQTYQPFEAAHILQCVNMFANRIAEVCNEEGEAVPTAAERFA